MATNPFAGRVDEMLASQMTFNLVTKIQFKIRLMKIINVFGIKFYDGDFRFVYSQISKGGLLVAPSGPGLANLKDQRYYNSLVNSDVAILDSGLLCLLIKTFTKFSVKKLSGYKFLNLLLDQLKLVKKIKIFTIDPSKEDSLSNKKYLNSIGVDIKNCQYIAPFYDEIEDKLLLSLIIEARPKVILINLGGGIQEPLGFYLKQQLKYKPIIICTGAAISFLTKKQAPISAMIDKFYLGWMLRCIYNPKAFLPRYFKSLALILSFFKAKKNIVCEFVR